MLDALFRVALVVLIALSMYGLYGTLNITINFEKPEAPIDEVMHVTYSELAFVIISWLLFLLLVNFRLLLLVAFVAGQSSLYVISPEIRISQRTYPTYVMIAANSLYLLVMYFYFSAEKWKSGSIEEIDEKYRKSD